MEQVLRFIDDHLMRELQRLDEWIDLENFHPGIKSAAHLYDELSRLEDQR